MKKHALYLILIIILLVLNLLQIGFFLGGQKHRNNQRRHIKGFKHNAIEMLQLDNSQKERFYQLGKDHREGMQRLNQRHRSLTLEYFSNPTETLLDSIKTLEGEKIQFTQKHFSDIQLLLTDEQKQKFNKFKRRALNRIVR